MSKLVEPTDTRALKVTVYGSESPLRNPINLILTLFRELWGCRELTWIIFVRNLKAQYRQSLMGYVWLIVPPITTTLIWFFLNNQRIIRVETEIPYPLFVLIGTSIWTSFVSLVQQPLEGFLSGKPVIMKLKVPAEAFIMASVLRAIFELGIRVTLIIPLFVLYDYTPPLTCVLFPLALISVISPALALGLIITPVGSLFGDVRNAVSSFIGLLMYTAPVVFPVPKDDSLLALVMKYNPLTPGIALCRDLLVNGSFEWLIPALINTGVSLILCFTALVVLRVAMPHLVQRMGM